MSDNYIKIATAKQIKEPESKSKRVIEWMQQNNYIESELSKSGLGRDDLAFKPSLNHIEIIGYDENITRLNACGVEFKTGRQVSNSLAFNPLIKMICKHCGDNIFKDFTAQEFYNDATPPDKLKLYTVMFKLFKKQEKGEAASLICPICDQQSNLDEYEIEGSICLTNFEMTFWYWTDLKTEFINDLQDLIQSPIKRMNGHL